MNNGISLVKQKVAQFNGRTNNENGYSTCLVGYLVCWSIIFYLEHHMIHILTDIGQIEYIMTSSLIIIKMGGYNSSITTTSM